MAAGICTMAAFDLNSYFARIGYSGPSVTTLSTLRQLHALHPAAIVFENLDVLLKRPIRLDVESLVQKLIYHGRGGYCYEQNTLFQSALQTIGFSVSTVGGRVLWRYPSNAANPRYHMVLRIRLPNADYIADVGFGLMTLTAPLRLETGVEQSTPHGTYRLMPVGEEMRLEAKTSEGWAAVYQISLQEQASADWEMCNWYTSTHPNSRFTRELVVARPAEKRRYGLLNNVLSTYYLDGTTERHMIQTAEGLETILRNVFNINDLEDHKAILTSLWQKKKTV